MQHQRKFSLLPIAATVVVLLIGIAWIALIQANTLKPEPRIPTKFVLAQGFTGKVKILYEVPGAPPLAIEDGYRVVPIPLSGQYETSSPMLYGTAEDKFFRHTADGGLQELGTHYLKMRKNGVVGDNREYFESTSELEQRNEWLRKQGQVDEEGNILLGGAYEMFIVRDDFEER